MLMMLNVVMINVIMLSVMAPLYLILAKLALAGVFIGCVTLFNLDMLISHV
jgi:hypothetical protein